MNFEEFKKGFERLCRSLGGKFKKERRGKTETLTCYDIPKGNILTVDVRGSELAMMHKERITLDGLRESSVHIAGKAYIGFGEEVSFGQVEGEPFGHVFIGNVEEISVSYDKIRDWASVFIHTHK